MKTEKLNSESVFHPKNHREWFLFYLFNDEDFIKKAVQIRTKIKTLVGEDAYPVIMLLAAKRGFIDQLKDYRGADSIVRSIKDLAKHFEISVATAEQGLRYADIIPERAIKSAPQATIDGNNVVIRLTADSRLADIKAMFWQVEEFQRQLPGYKARNRDKERPDLIYAIYKQRLLGKTFKEIYDLYEYGELPMYSGIATITGEENLARMYRRFKPDS